MLAADMTEQIPSSERITKWLRDALSASGMSQASLADALNGIVPKKVDRSTVNKMTLGKRDMSAGELLAISEITKHPLPNRLVEPTTIAIAGLVGAGAQVPLVDAYEKGDGPQVEAPAGLPTHGVVAVEVEGDSMEPVYSAGDLLFYTRHTSDGVPDDVIGHRCVCEDEDGMAWVKQVKPGSEPGLFHLISINPGAITKWDVRLRWAARVRLHWPAEMARKV
ncbi:MAG: S24 family peptidase [Celeribacter sp.]